MKRYFSILVATASVLFLTVAVHAQERKVIITTTEGGRQVTKEYSGVELEKLIAAHKVPDDIHLANAAETSKPAERQIIINEPGKKPMVIKGAELNKLIAQKKSTSPVSAIAPSTHSMVVTKQPDGSVKIMKDGSEVNSR